MEEKLLSFDHRTFNSAINDTIQNSLTLSEHITSILDYFETEEGIIHQKIGLYASSSTADFAPILMTLKRQLPMQEIEYTNLEEGSISSCTVTNVDLSIKIPKLFLQGEPGLFKYDFQSHIKNIYGKLEVNVKYDEGIWISENQQFFTTSIGN